jgi:hypothetical protein
VSRRSLRSSIAVAALATLLVSATAMAKSPSIALTWTGNHGDLVAQLDPALDPAWSQGDGITEGTFLVAVYWPGEHIRSAYLHRENGGDWGAYSGNAVSWGLGVSVLPNGPLVNGGDSSFDLATNSKGWVTFFLHADSYPGREGNLFTHASQFTLTVCTDAVASNCMDSAMIRIR